MHRIMALARSRWSLLVAALGLACGGPAVAAEPLVPQLVADIVPGPSDSYPEVIGVHEGWAYFGAFEPATGYELWRSDGTSTARVADIAPGPGSSEPRRAVSFNGWLYFTAETPALGREIWRTDGTTTQPAFDVEPGSASSGPNELTVAHGRLYFTATTAATGAELYWTDGTTLTLIDGEPGIAGSWPTSLTTIDDALYYSTTRPAFGREMRRITGGLPFLVAGDLAPGADSSNPSGMTTFDGEVYFVATTPTTGRELWHLTPMGPQVVDIVPGASGSDPSGLTVLGDTLYFTATTPAAGKELWMRRGNITTLAKDISPGAPSSSPESLRVAAGMLFFTASRPDVGKELWGADGASAPRLIADINPGPPSSSPWSVLAHGGRAYFAAQEPTLGTELYSTDGVTVDLVSDLLPGPDGSIAGSDVLTSLNGAVLFSGDDGRHGLELWKLAPPLPAVAPPPNVPPADRTVRIAVAGSRFVLTKKGTLNVRVTCPKTEVHGPCRGSVGIATRTRIQVGRKKRVITIATGTYAVPAGTTRTVTLRVGTANRTRIATSRPVRATRMTVTVRDTVGNRFTLRRNTTVLPTPKPKAKPRRAKTL